jgi:iron complex transport system permease protein
MTVALGLLGGATLLAAALGLALGSGALDWGRVWRGEGLDAAIVWRARLPRVGAGALLGGGLAAVGVVFQALLRNPLADPYILGVSGGAALGGALALALLPAVVGGVQASAFGGALLATALLWRLARGRTGASALVILLGGVVFNAFAGAGVLLIEAIVEARKAQEILFWLMGTLAVETLGLRELALAAALVVGASAWMLRHGRALNALALGDEGARGVGVDVVRLRRSLLVAACVVVGAAVSVGGLIGFVGLVVPHLLRLVLGPDHRLLLPASVLGGAAFLVLCDLGSRLLFGAFTTELPVGVVTAFLGGPLFLYLLWRERERLA